MIDRSNPLPIHEFPSLIDAVAGLKELHGSIGPYPRSTYTEEFALNRALRTAAPKLLDALDFRAGDAALLEWMLKENDGFEEYQWTEELQEQITNMLHRYRDMAREMEANR